MERNVLMRGRLTALAGLLGLAFFAGCAGPSESTTTEIVSSSDDALALVSNSPVDMDGNPLALEAGLAAGRPLVLVFWQSWCESCLEEAPGLGRAARSLSGKVDFLGVVPGKDGTVNEDRVRQISDELGMPYAHLRDRTLEWTRTFKVDGTPTMIALNEEGDIIWRGNHAPKDWKSALHLGF
ncbi:MAG: thiol-disulfide isomerase/thioredoxin [Planctomycetota bacterium]|jgi:thiol-disulfide isomerase/thioredoxin